jgi:hypothetical protein
MFKYLIRKTKNKQNPQVNSNKRKPHSQQEYFNNIISFTDEILKNTAKQNRLYKQYYSKGNEHPLLDVVRLTRNLLFYQSIIFKRLS